MQWNLGNYDHANKNPPQSFFSCFIKWSWRYISINTSGAILVNNKNTKLFLVRYVIDFKTCICTAETEIVCWENWANETLKKTMYRDLTISCLDMQQPPILTGVSIERKVKHWEIKDIIQDIFLEIKGCFKNMKIFKRKIITSIAIHTGK